MDVSETTAAIIPFLDLAAPHLELAQELTDVFRKVMLTAGFVGGPVVEQFETAFAEIGRAHV